MADTPIVLRKRIVQAYIEGLSGSYRETAKLFGVGEATVSRLLRLYRETKSVVPKPRGGNFPAKIDLDWLRHHTTANPDARLCDRVAALEAETGIHVSTQSMSRAMRKIGWTHKKRRRSRGNVNGRT
jgi:transposase